MLRTWYKSCGMVFLWMMVFVLIAQVNTLAASQINTSNGNPITIKSSFTMTEDPESIQKIFLAGLSPEENGAPSVLSATWEVQPQGWFSYWYVVIHSETGLIPVELCSPGNQDLQVGPMGPVQGHIYEFVLSYHPNLGYLSFSFVDQTDGKRIGEGSWNLRKSAGGLVGVAAKGSKTTYYPWYEPATSIWDVGTGTADTFVPSGLFENRGDASLRLVALGVLPGTYRLLSSSGSELAQIHGSDLITGKNWLSVPTADLPLGPTELTLQYIDQGQVIYNDTRQIVVGKLSATLSQAKLNATTHELEASLAVQSASALHDVALKLQVSISAVAWSAATSTYGLSAHSTKIIDLGRVSVQPNKAVVIPVSLPIPDQPGLWRADFRLTPDPAIKTEATSPAVLFSTQTWSVLGGGGANPGASADKTVRIGTYNILGFTGYPEQNARAELGYTTDPRHIEYFTNALRSLKCDILGLQEGSSVGMMTQYANKMNIQVAAFPSGTAFPGGVYARFPILETHFYGDISFLGSHRPFSRTGSAVLLNVDGKKLWVINIHAHVNDRELRKQEAEILDRELDKLMQVTPYVVVTGDFNSFPDEIIHETLRKHNLYNAMQILDLIQPGRYERIVDHIYVSDNLVGYLQAGEVVSSPGFVLSSEANNDGTWRNSDHRPVVIELRWP